MTEEITPENITPEGSVAPIYLIERESEEFDEPHRDSSEQQAARESALGKLRLLGLTDPEIAAILPQ